MQGLKNIAVIGAGIGGLTAALSLYRAGFEVDVFEQAEELTTIGGGINMGANAVRILYRLGLAEGIEREGVLPSEHWTRRWDDARTLQRSPVNPRCVELYGAPHVTIHRADLLGVIAAEFPSERVHLGHRLAHFADRGGRVEASFENGAHAKADILASGDHQS